MTGIRTRFLAEKRNPPALTPSPLPAIVAARSPMKGAPMTRTFAAFGVTLLACTLWAFAPARQDDNKWTPYQFKGNERFEYKFSTRQDDGSKREVTYILDIRKKGEEDFDVTWSIKVPVKKQDMGEKLMVGMWAEAAPAWILMNPMFQAFLGQVELKEGEKLSLFGAGVIKVSGKETV